MKLEEAIEIIKLYNEFRHGADIPMKVQSFIGLAMDTVLEHTECKNVTHAFAVIPDTERLDIGKNSAVAIFKHREQAKKFATSMWGQYFLIEEVNTYLFART